MGRETGVTGRGEGGERRQEVAGEMRGRVRFRTSEWRPGNREGVASSDGPRWAWEFWTAHGRTAPPYRGCQECGMEIICGHCSHTCQTCSLTKLCYKCIDFPRTEDGKTQCIECTPTESDSSDDTYPTQTGPHKRQKTDHKPL